MSIEVNGIDIPEDDHYFSYPIGDSVFDVDEIEVNGVTVWKYASPIASLPKNAPPFLSAGWKTLVSYRWVATGYENGITTYNVETQDDGTRWISETEINAYYWIQESETKKGYLFYLPTPIETGSFSNFSFTFTDEFDDDTSEGRIYGLSFQCCRFSNDGVTWDSSWEARTTPDRSYKYAQVGFFTGGTSDSAVAMWGKCIITSFTFH